MNEDKAFNDGKEGQEEKPRTLGELMTQSRFLWNRNEGRSGF